MTNDTFSEYANNIRIIFIIEFQRRFNASKNIFQIYPGTGYICKTTYRRTSNIRCTKYQDLNVSRLVLQLSLPNPFKPDITYITSRVKMQLDQGRQAMP